MKRRHVLQSLAILPGVGLMSGAEQQPATPKAARAPIDETPTLQIATTDSAAETVEHYFSESQFQVLERLSDIIAPPISGVPGALAAGVPAFLDFLTSQSSAHIQNLYRDGLDALNHQAQSRFKTDFKGTTASQADEILAPLRKPWTYEAPAEPLQAFLVLAKGQILQGTVNSREWISVVSKRDRRASGLGTYWHTID
ncbi:MAG TPA: gluconate 2-dehydrogenase subunit 3 family protein [Bryobacteraceae bacterium]|nr:gluconate 2-dehydrogenase subunit 3 family protein [Bryobacteraceae bacterium]